MGLFAKVTDQPCVTELLRSDVPAWDEKNVMAIVSAMAVDAKTLESRRKIDVSRMMMNRKSIFEIATTLLLDIVVDVLSFIMKCTWMACQPLVSVETFAHSCD